MEDILDVTAKPLNDDSISYYQYAEYTPGVGNDLNRPGEVTIDIYGSDEFFHLHNSYLIFQGTLMKAQDGQTEPAPVAATDAVTFSNLGVLHCFRMFQYQLGGSIVETLYQPAISTLIKKLFAKSKKSLIIFLMRQLRLVVDYLS